MCLQVYICHDLDTGRELAVKQVEIGHINSATQKVSCNGSILSVGDSHCNDCNNNIGINFIDLLFLRPLHTD